MHNPVSMWGASQGLERGRVRGPLFIGLRRFSVAFQSVFSKLLSETTPCQRKRPSRFTRKGLELLRVSFKTFLGRPPLHVREAREIHVVAILRGTRQNTSLARNPGILGP